MDIEFKVSKGGGKKIGRETHSKTIKEVGTLDQAVDEFRQWAGQYIPAQATLTQATPKRKTRDTPAPGEKA